MADGDVLTIVTGHQAFAAPSGGGGGSAVIQSATDPGVEPDGTIWEQIDDNYFIRPIYIRNTADSTQGNGWDVPAIATYGSDGLNPTPTAWVFATYGTVQAQVQLEDETPTSAMLLLRDRAELQFIGAAVRRVYVFADGVRYDGLNAAISSDDLAAGQFSLWLDQTDGAAKLMVKAKTADGTVVTGSLNLT